MIFDDIERWLAAGRGVALARVVAVEGSAPREPGAAMAVNEDGEVAGSVSGGCVESAVITTAFEVLTTGTAALCEFGCADEDGLGVGLTCGGTLLILVERLGGAGGQEDPVIEGLAGCLRAGAPVALATLVREEKEATPALGAAVLVRADGTTVGSLGDQDLDCAVVHAARGQLGEGTTGLHHFGSHGEAWKGERAVLIQAFAAPPQMLIFGALDFSAALARVAGILGYRVTVCDPRPIFSTVERFPTADVVVADRPDRYLALVGDSLGPRDAVCVLTHDPMFDVPAIVAALDTAVGYIGAMGSRRTTEARRELLRAAGVDATGLDRVMAPIGLDIGARTPEETAVSICAEIVARRAGYGSGASLRAIDGPIHHPLCS